MELEFHKYQAAGNDFIVFDGRNQVIPTNADFLFKICDRRFGIGADGVVIIKDHDTLAFEVVYLNPDGSISLCGNGTRAAIRFAKKAALFSGTEVDFQAYDGPHHASIISDGNISLDMANVKDVRFFADGTFVDTGSPHLVCFVENVDKQDVFNLGRKLRQETPVENGTNVNFVEILGEHELKIRTYERGVEDETLSCGTGVTASALLSSTKNLKSPVTLHARGGTLKVEFEGNADNGFHHIRLIGPAEEVFTGFYSIDN